MDTRPAGISADRDLRGSYDGDILGSKLVFRDAASVGALVCGSAFDSVYYRLWAACVHGGSSDLQMLWTTPAISRGPDKFQASDSAECGTLRAAGFRYYVQEAIHAGRRW